MKTLTPFKFILLTVLMAVTSVMTLAIATGMFIITSTGFDRILKEQMPKLANNIPIPEEVNAIVGVSQGQIILNTKAANKLYACKLNLDFPHYLPINLDGIPADSRNITHEIYDSLIYTFAGNQNSIILNDPTQRRATTHTDIDVHFTRGIALCNHQFVLRAFDPDAKKKDQYFIKSDSNGIMVGNSRVTPRFNDAGIATDGLLHYDKINSLVIYTYFYSNRILCMDTDLKLRYTINTIDTFTGFYNRAVEIKEKGGRSKFSYDRPPQLANLDQSISKGLLYNLSLIKADNEKGQDFKDNSVIDVYDLKKAHYLYSFYLPSLNGKKVRAIFVYNNLLIALYNSQLATFVLRQF